MSETRRPLEGVIQDTNYSGLFTEPVGHPAYQISQ